MREKILQELNLTKNVCFNQVSETNDTIHITKSKSPVVTTTETREICNISDILYKYKDTLDISISLNEVIIKF